MKYSREDWKELGRKLSIARQRRSMSQVEVARQIGINQGRMSDIELGKVVPGVDELQSILVAIGITRDELEATNGVPLLRDDGSLISIPPQYKEVANEGTFGAQVRAAREALGLTQYRLSQRSGVSRNYICEIEKGYKENLSWDIRQKLSKVLGLNESAEPLPPGLQDYAIADNLTEEDVSMLRCVHCSGIQPDTVKGWRKLHNAIMGAIVKGRSSAEDVQVELDGHSLAAIKEILDEARPYSDSTVGHFVGYAAKLLADYGDVLIEGLRRVHEGDREVVLKIELDPPEPFPIPADIVGQRIRELRREAGLTQDALSRKSGVGKNYRIYKIERGIVAPKREELEAIAQVFGVEVRDLLNVH